MRVIPTVWNPAEFHFWYEQQDPDVKTRAMADLSPSARRRYREWILFGGFYRASNLNVSPSSVEVCDPPIPNVCCSIGGSDHYFELGEVIVPQVARSTNIAAKTGTSSGGPVSTCAPLLALFRKKCLKRYITNGTPLHLLLYFSVGHQCPTGYPKLSSSMNPGEFEDSQFKSVFIYNDWDKKILEGLTR